MIVLAVSAEWIGLAGVAIGGVLAFFTSWLVHRSERAERIAERSREERKEAYAALLTSTEDAMHLFEWLAEGHYVAAELEAERTRADHFYDDNATQRYRVLKIVGTHETVDAAREMRRALNTVRHLMVDGPAEAMPTIESREFGSAQHGYRRARDTFVDSARADLEK